MRISAIAKISRDPDRQPDEDGSMDMLLRLKSEGAYKPLYPRLNGYDMAIIRAHALAESLGDAFFSDGDIELRYLGRKDCLRSVLKKRRHRNPRELNKDAGYIDGVYDFHD